VKIVLHWSQTHEVEIVPWPSGMPIPVKGDRLMFGHGAQSHNGKVVGRVFFPEEDGGQGAVRLHLDPTDTWYDVEGG